MTYLRLVAFVAGVAGLVVLAVTTATMGAGTTLAADVARLSSGAAAGLALLLIAGLAFHSHERAVERRAILRLIERADDLLAAYARVRERAEARRRGGGP